jgi:hypothetical protein
MTQSSIGAKKTCRRHLPGHPFKGDSGIRGHRHLWPKGHNGKDSLSSAAGAIDGTRSREKSHVFSVELILC